MLEEFPSPHAILDDWRVHLCDVSHRAYGGLCRHDYSDRMMMERAKEMVIKDHEKCLSKGQEAIRKRQWRKLFKNVLGVTFSYPYSDNPSIYKFCKTKAEENALAAVGYYFTSH